MESNRNIYADFLNEKLNNPVPEKKTRQERKQEVKGLSVTERNFRNMIEIYQVARRIQITRPDFTCYECVLIAMKQMDIIPASTQVRNVPDYAKFRVNKIVRVLRRAPVNFKLAMAKEVVTP